MRESAKLQTFAFDGAARAAVAIVENFILFLFKALYLMLVLNCEKMETGLQAEDIRIRCAG